MSKQSYNIAVIPGDGVGTEICKEAIRTGEKAAEISGIGLSFDWFDWSCEYYEKNGKMMPDDALDTLVNYDAIYLGCIGDVAKVPDHISLTLVLTIRKHFDQYINLRPMFLYEGVRCPLRDIEAGSIDMVVVRENVEGEYARTGGRFKEGTADEVALQTGVFTRKGTERVMRYAFDLAKKRAKYGDSGKDYKGMVTNCTKSNALNYSMVFWDDVYKAVAKDYPDIKTDTALVDALTMWFVKKPQYFDVIVASNLFGDIITDLGAMIQGGMGFAAGGNINPEKTFPSMFEPIHGSAPKYAGKGIVNPIASVEAMRMLFEHLELEQPAKTLHQAVKKVLADGTVRTKDMDGTASTSEMGDAVLQAIEA